MGRLVVSGSGIVFRLVRCKCAVWVWVSCIVNIRHPLCFGRLGIGSLGFQYLAGINRSDIVSLNFQYLTVFDQSDTGGFNFKYLTVQ